jgi:DNA polymerase-3 subunit delta
MAGEAPVVYLLYGEDEFGIASFLSELSARLGDAATASMNTTRLDGNTVSLEELRGATFALPFLASRRLVVSSNTLARLNSEELREKFIHLLEQLPASTALALVEQHKLADDHWMFAWARQAGSRAFVRRFSLYKEGDMAQWIQGQAKQSGGQISYAAARALARMVGTDTRLAYHEVQKLLAYVGYERPVEVEDVETLTVGVFNERIFALVDAMAAQDGKNASRLLRQFLEEEEPGYIMIMIVRQFRLLLLAREILDQGGIANEVKSRLKLRTDFEAGKITEQARRFSLQALEGVHRSLLDIDEAIKTGKIEDEVALDGMVAGFTTR